VLSCLTVPGVLHVYVYLPAAPYEKLSVGHLLTTTAWYDHAALPGGPSCRRWMLRMLTRHFKLWKPENCSLQASKRRKQHISRTGGVRC
jgi:hypothetical protein